MVNWADRMGTVSAAWRAKRDAAESPANSAAADAARGRAELEDAARQLETDLAKVVEQITAVTQRGEALEQQAMRAITDGDDAAARAVLIIHGKCKAQAELLEADAQVLRAMIDECREVLAQTPQP